MGLLQIRFAAHSLWLTHCPSNLPLASILRLVVQSKANVTMNKISSVLKSMYQG